MKTLSHKNLLDLTTAFQGKVYALTPVTFDDRWAVGVAVANERGYTPLPISWCNIEMGPTAYDEIARYLDTVNHDTLKLNDRAAMKIVCSSMQGAT